VPVGARRAHRRTAARSLRELDQQFAPPLLQCNMGRFWGGLSESQPVRRLRRMPHAACLVGDDGPYAVHSSARTRNRSRASDITNGRDLAVALKRLR
jgi:hypothetical protein